MAYPKCKRLICILHLLYIWHHSDMAYLKYTSPFPYKVVVVHFLWDDHSHHHIIFIIIIPQFPCSLTIAPALIIGLWLTWYVVSCINRGHLLEKTKPATQLHMQPHSCNSYFLTQRVDPMCKLCYKNLYKISGLVLCFI